MSAHGVFLVLHSWLRWLLLGLALTVFVRSLLARGRTWSELDEKLHKAFVGATDAQFAIGAVLYAFLSPLPRALFADPGHGMKDATLRFFGVEHAFGMVIAIVIIHVARAKSKRLDDAKRHARVWQSTIAALIVFALTIPWPGRKYARPLFRADAGVVVPSGSPAAASAGACTPIYQARCQSCHGTTGHGDGMVGQALKPPPRDFAKLPPADQRSDKDLAKVIREGGAANGLSVAMPPNSDLSDADVDALVACVRSLAAAK